MATSIIENFTNVIQKLDEQAQNIVETTLPSCLHILAINILRSIPESIVAASCMAGLWLPGALYLSARITIISMRQIELVFEKGGEFKIDDVVKELLSIHKFTPAAVVCAAVAATTHLIFGITHLAAFSFVQTGIYTLGAYLAFMHVLNVESVSRIEINSQNSTPPTTPEANTSLLGRIEEAVEEAIQSESSSSEPDSPKKSITSTPPPREAEHSSSLLSGISSTISELLADTPSSDSSHGSTPTPRSALTLSRQETYSSFDLASLI